MLRFRIIKLRVKIKYEKIQAVQIDRLKVCIIVKDIGNTRYFKGVLCTRFF